MVPDPYVGGSTGFRPHTGTTNVESQGKSNHLRNFNGNMANLGERCNQIGGIESTGFTDDVPEEIHAVAVLTQGLQ